jgi:hypothetical protein
MDTSLAKLPYCQQYVLMASRVADLLANYHNSPALAMLNPHSPDEFGTLTSGFDKMPADSIS